MFFKKSARNVTAAVEEFRENRETLEAQFFHAAATSGRPRGLRWVGCDFHGEPAFAHDPASGNLQTLVGVSIRLRQWKGAIWRTLRP